ncbi:hypothetical protein [Nonlabens sp.]|uniref:hypothetical protein n=1 Tax=Nonlabens sp. TaxID=1888209 RepID=UPI003263622B
MIKIKFFIFIVLLFCFKKGNTQENDKNAVYEEVISRLNIKPKDHLTIKTFFEFPNSVSLNGPIRFVPRDVFNLNDTIIINKMKIKFNDIIISDNYFNELDPISMKSFEKSYFIIHEPIDKWLNYHTLNLMHNKEYSPVLLPVERSYYNSIEEKYFKDVTIFKIELHPEVKIVNDLLINRIEMEY